MKRSERLMFLAGVLCAACAVTFGVVRTILKMELQKKLTKDKKQRCGHSYHPGGHSDSSLLGDGNGESLIS